MRKREIAYNTDIIRRGPELDELGYISINKLLLTRIDRRLIIKEAREGHNNLALNSSCPAEVFIKQEFYNNYLLQNSKQNPFLDIKIESKDSKFIEKLARFLKKQKPLTTRGFCQNRKNQTTLTKTCTSCRSCDDRPPAR